MIDEPNSVNGHEPTQNDTLSPELQRLAERLNADGTMWQSRLPDTAGVAARIRAVPLLAIENEDEVEGDFPMSIETPPVYGPPRGGGQPTRPGPGRGILAAVAAVLVVALIGAVLVALATRGSTNTGPVGQPTATQVVPTTTQPTATAATYPVQVYFSKNPDSYSDPNAVFGVGRVAPQANDTTYAIEQLIAGPTSAEAAQGYFTEVTAALSGASNCGGADFTITLNMKGSTPQNGTATLQFCDATHLPGDLSGPRVKAEITKTLEQFSGITAVVILGQDGHCFDDSAGADFCLQ